jgi:acyl-CoA reductase-like NAD-dependent aldehyde dehydrogenase
MTSPRGRPVGTFESLNPATGEVVGTLAIRTAEEARAAVEAARPAAQWWAALGFAGRGRRLTAWRAWLAKHSRELAELVHEENGKPTDDALIEIAVAVEHLDWAASHARSVLGRSRVRPGLLAVNHGASVEYLPYGVVGVIGPWNYPVHTPLGSISYALAAGNAVVFKPSEFTPVVGTWLADSFTRVVDGRPVFSVLTGLGETGQALCRAGVDKLAFTGSTTTGKKVMAACAESLTPVVIECGGKDAMIVADDADVEAAASAAAWGGLANAGQACVGIERVYVAAPLYDRFLASLASQVRSLRPGADRTADYGPITMAGQLEVIRGHVEAALDSGATAVVGGRDAVRPPYVEPVVLAGVAEDNPAVQEETFGPVLTVTRVSGDDEAVRLANGTRYGLGSAVFSAKRGRQIAERLRAGMVSVNSVLTFASVPGLPFGGIGDSGFGRIHGADGLREFAWPRAVTVRRLPAPIEVSTFARKPAAIRNLLTLVQARWGRAPR